jgi:hypothetical protein
MVNTNQIDWSLFGNLIIILSYAWGVAIVIFGKYKPDLISRGGWMTMSVLSAALLQTSKANRAIIICAWIMALGSIILFIISKRITHDHGSIFIYKLAILGTALASVTYLYTHNQALTILSVLITDFLVGLPTLRGVWRRASSEDTFFWGSFMLGFAILSLSTERNNPAGIIFSVYFTLYAFMIVAIKYRKRVNLVPKLLRV